MNQTNQTRPREYSVAVAPLAVSAVAPTHVYLACARRVIRVEGDNGDARLPVSVLYGDLAVVKKRRQRQFVSLVNVASTGSDTFDLLSIPVFRLVASTKPIFEPLGNLIS